MPQGRAGCTGPNQVIIEGRQAGMQTSARPSKGQAKYNLSERCKTTFDIAIEPAGSFPIWKCKELDAGKSVIATHHEPYRAARVCSGPRASAWGTKQPSKPKITTCEIWLLPGKITIFLGEERA